MAHSRSASSGEVVVDGVRHRAHQQDALGADGARRRHRHHVDRRHDGDDPRLRPVAARPDRRDRTRTRSSCQRFGVTNFANGAEFSELLKRPNLTISDARALEDAGDHAPARRHRARRRRRPADAAARVLPRLRRPSRSSCSARREYFAEGTQHPVPRRPVLQRHRSAVPEERRRARQHGRTSCCSSRPAPIRSARPSASAPSGSKWSACSTSGRRAGGFSLGPGRLRRHPVHDLSAHLRPARRSRVGAQRDASCRSRSRCVPREGVPPGDAMADVERVMRIRHGLKLDEPNDFDIAHAGCVPEAVGPDQPGRRSSRWS